MSLTLQNSRIKRIVLIGIFDLLIALFAFKIVNYSYDIDASWKEMILVSFIWLILGMLSSKLNFGAYKRVKYLYVGLFILDLIMAWLIYMGLKYAIPGYNSIVPMLASVGIIFLLESVMYYLLRLFVYSKIPYFYEEPLADESVEAINQKKTETQVFCQDISSLLEAIANDESNLIDVVLPDYQSSTVILDTANPEVILKATAKDSKLIIHRKALNEIRYINKLFAYTNYQLSDNGYMVSACETAYIRRDRIKKEMPRSLSKVAILWEYFIHRMMPKLPVIKNIYYNITKGERRSLTRVEVLGRLYRSGFDVVYEKIVNGKFYVVAQKIKEPITDDKPSNGILIRLKRKGLNGKQIGVYKFRTMHAYSEYLQPYVYRTEGIENGKYANDFRITTLGKFLRATFLDELPMLLNWFKGDLKLVGVRPLSAHFFSLYSKELQELRVKTKPGLVPPYYIIKPKTVEDKQNIELQYLHEYFKKPIRTDWKYFWMIFNSIVFKGVRGE